MIFHGENSNVKREYVYVIVALAIEHAIGSSIHPNHVYLFIFYCI